MSYWSCSRFCLLDRAIQTCVSCFRAVQIWFLSTILSYWPLDVQHGTSWQRTRIVALHKDGLGYKKFGNSLKLSYSSDQGHIEVFQDGFPSEQTPHGAIKEVESLYCASGAEAGFKKQPHECCQHCFRGCRSERTACQCSDIHHTQQQVGLHGHRPRRKPLLGLAYKKACKPFAEDNLAKSMNYWNHVLWSDESKRNLFDSDGVQHVWRCPREEYK